MGTHLYQSHIQKRQTRLWPLLDRFYPLLIPSPVLWVWHTKKRPTARVRSLELKISIRLLHGTRQSGPCEIVSRPVKLELLISLNIKYAFEQSKLHGWYNRYANFNHLGTPNISPTWSTLPRGSFYLLTSLRISRKRSLRMESYIQSSIAVA